MIKDNHETEITKTNETTQPAPATIPQQKRDVQPSADIIYRHASTDRIF